MRHAKTPCWQRSLYRTWSGDSGTATRRCRISALWIPWHVKSFALRLNAPSVAQCVHCKDSTLSPPCSRWPTIPNGSRRAWTRSLGSNIFTPLLKQGMDKDDFRRKWGLQRADLQGSTHLLKVFICQFLATLLIFHIVRPGFVLTRSSAHASETFHFGAAVVIAGIVCVLTFYHPTLRLHSVTG